jgi:hypothetical protein
MMSKYLERRYCYTWHIVDEVGTNVIHYPMRVVVVVVAFTVIDSTPLRDFQLG